MHISQLNMKSATATRPKDTSQGNVGQPCSAPYQVPSQLSHMGRDIISVMTKMNMRVPSKEFLKRVFLQISKLLHDNNRIYMVHFPNAHKCASYDYLRIGYPHILSYSHGASMIWTPYASNAFVDTLDRLRLLAQLLPRCIS